MIDIYICVSFLSINKISVILWTNGYKNLDFCFQDTIKKNHKENI